MCEKVDIIMSIYKPNEEYFIKQLKSLNEQDYPNITLYVYDDCVTQKTNIDIIKKYITNIELKIIESKDKNLGYIGAFEELTKHTTGKYVAFCDQDDVWFPNKISKSVEILKKEKTLLVASERQIIDGNDKIIKERAREGSKKNYDNWHSYDDITKYTSVICYAAGMSIVIDGDLVRSIIPFSRNTGHDEWAMICASIEGKVSFCEEPLVQYRRHGKNVSGVLVGIDTKKDYIESRVMPNVRLLEDIKKKYPHQKDLKELNDFVIKGRYKHNLYYLWKYRNLAPDVAKFDIVIQLIPNFLFKFFVKLVKKIA